MDSPERNRISVFPSYQDAKTPWRLVGTTLIDNADHLIERAEVLAETLQNEPNSHLIKEIAPTAYERDNERRGGLVVDYYDPGMTKLIYEAIASTLGMDEYGLRYKQYPGIHQKRTTEQIRSLQFWQPY